MVERTVLYGHTMSNLPRIFTMSLQFCRSNEPVSKLITTRLATTWFFSLTNCYVSATKGALEAGGVTPPAPGSMRAGHHRGARNVFFETLRDPETNCFKSSEELQQRECSCVSSSCRRSIFLEFLSYNEIDSIFTCRYVIKTVKGPFI